MSYFRLRLVLLSCLSVRFLDKNVVCTVSMFHIIALITLTLVDEDNKPCFFSLLLLSVRSKQSSSSHFSHYERPSFMPVRNKIFSAHTNTVIVNSNSSSPFLSNPVILKSYGVLSTTHFHLSTAYLNIMSPHSVRTFF
jgi:hypothetical protein